MWYGISSSDGDDGSVVMMVMDPVKIEMAMDIYHRHIHVPDTAIVLMAMLGYVVTIIIHDMMDMVHANINNINHAGKCVASLIHTIMIYQEVACLGGRLIVSLLYWLCHWVHLLVGGKSLLPSPSPSMIPSL